MKDLAGLMKQAQALQSQVQDAQARVEALERVGAAGAGLVEVTLSGRGEVRRVKIDPSLLDPQEVEVLEDLITAAFTDAKRKIDTAAKDAMSEVTGGLGALSNVLPPGFKPF
jgi:hypothetical protein